MFKKYLKIFFVIVLSSVSVACSGGGDGYDDYVGLWKSKFMSSSVLEIVKKDGDYVLRRVGSHVGSPSNEEIGKIKKEGKNFLVIMSRSGSKRRPVPDTFLRMSDDKNNLSIGMRGYARIDEKEFKEIKKGKVLRFIK